MCSERSSATGAGSQRGAAEARQPPPGGSRWPGAGPGDEGLLTVRAAELLGQAAWSSPEPDLEAVARRYMSQDARLADPARRGGHRPRCWCRRRRSGQLAVRLFSGDPLLSGAAADAAACAKAGSGSRSCPACPAATAVPAYAGIPLASDAQRRAAGHPRRRGQPGWRTARPRWWCSAPDAGPADLGKMLIAAGWPEATPFAITWDGTTSAQQTVVSTLGRIGARPQGGRGVPGQHQGLGRRRGRRRRWRPGTGCRGSRPSRCSAGGCWCRGPRSRPRVVSQRLREYGAVPEEVPTIAVEPPRTPQQMERAVKGLVTGRYQWVAFTSANAVRAVREKIRGVRPGRPGVRRGQGGRRRRADGRVAARVRHPARPGAGGGAVGRGPGRGLAAVRRRARPDQPGAAAARGHRDRDAAGPADRPGLGGRGRHRVPDGARGAAARADPRGHQGRRVRRRAVHLVLDGPEPGRHRGQAARGDRDRGHRPADREDRGRVRAARRRDGAQAVDGGAGRRPGRVRRGPARRGRGGGRARPAAQRAPPRRPPRLR